LAVCFGLPQLRVSEDTYGYESLAVAVHSFTYGPANDPLAVPVGLIRPPVYPLYLSLFVRNGAVVEDAAVLVQSLLTGLFTALLFWFLNRLAGYRVATFGTIAFAIDWASCLSAGMILSDALFSIVLGSGILLYGLYLKERELRLCAASGAVIGLSALTKPIGQLTLLAFVITWLFDKRRTRRDVAFLLMYAAVVVPWIAHNWVRYGVPEVSAVDAVNVELYTAQPALAHWKPFSDLAGGQLEEIVHNAFARWQEAPMPLPERVKFLWRHGIEVAITHPAFVVEQELAGVGRILLGPGGARSLHGAFGSVIRIAAALELLLFWAAFCYGAIAAFRAPPWPSSVNWLLAAMLTLLPVAAAPVGYSRFRVPMVPIAVAIVGLGISEALLRFRTGRPAAAKELRKASMASW
jgi:hypothetical protein